MINEIMIFIFEYVDIYFKFSMEDLFVYFYKKIGINKFFLVWYLFKFVNENKLVRIGCGMYVRILKLFFVL